MHYSLYLGAFISAGFVSCNKNNVTSAVYVGIQLADCGSDYSAAAISHHGIADLLARCYPHAANARAVVS